MSVKFKRENLNKIELIYRCDSKSNSLLNIKKKPNQVFILNLSGSESFRKLDLRCHGYGAALSQAKTHTKVCSIKPNMSQSALCISNTWTASALPQSRVTSGDVFKFISRHRSSSCQWEICSFVISQVTDSEGSSKWFMPTRGKNLSRSKRMRVYSLKEEVIMLKHLHELSVVSLLKNLLTGLGCRY